MTVFAWLFRYPTDAEEPPTTEALSALGVAREVYDAVAARLPRDARP